MAPASPPPLPERTFGLREVLVLGAGLAVAGVLAVIALSGAQSISPEEIARRCKESTPRWDSYQEDIKAQLGARPAAQWRGHPLSARLERGRLYLTMSIEGPWSELDCAMPLLLRDPSGEVHTSHEADGDGGERTYRFTLPDAGSQRYPWVELHYPHNVLRIPLGLDGTWQALPKAAAAQDKGCCNRRPPIYS